MQRIKQLNGETQIVEIMVGLYQLQHIAKTVGIAENLLKKSSLVAKSKQVMDEPVGSQMVHGKLLVKFIKAVD
jgi:hypothetical protein